MKLSGKVALVTGASGNGIGRSTALTLAREGAHVIINYKSNHEKADELAKFIQSKGGQASAIQGNVFLEEDCKRMVDEIIKNYNKIDICVIGPGADFNVEDITDLNAKKSLQDIYQEVAPVYYLLPSILKDMKKRQFGRIIGIGSNMKMLSPSYSYNSSKAARIRSLELLVKSAWQYGVTVNIIAPAPVNELSSLETANSHCEHTETYTNRKNISPQDIAEGIAFLCSDDARYISGCTLEYMF